MVDARGVDKADVVFGEGGLGQFDQLDPVGRGVLAHGGVYGARKAVEEAALDAAVLEQLANVFQRVHRVLSGLGGETVHQIGVHQHPRVGESLGHLGHLRHAHAFFHQLEQTVGGDFQAATHRDAAALCEQLGEFGREGFLEPYVAPPRDLHATAQQLFGQCLEGFGWRGLVHEVKAGLTGFGHDALDAVDQLGGAGRLITADVVQADVAKTALLPIAAVRHGQFVPTPIAPQAVHGVEHVEQAEVLVQRQAVPGGRADVFERDLRFDHVGVLHLTVGLAAEGALQALRAALPLQVFDQREHGALARVQGDEVHEVKDARLFQLAQLGVHVAAAHGDAHVGVRCLDGLGHAQRGVNRTREGHRQEHELRRVALHRIQGQALDRLVEQGGRGGQGFRQRLEGGLAAGQVLRVTHELKAFVDRIAQNIGQIVQKQRGDVTGAVLHAQGTKGPTKRVAAAIVLVHVQ